MSTMSASPPPLTSAAKRKVSEISDTLDEVDEPVLSHAEQRRQKKKQKRDNGAQESDGNRKSFECKSKSDPLPKRQNSVWVGNLAFKTTPVSLKAFFDGVGEMTRIHMPMKAATGKGPRENSGFAYVDFATKDAKVVAMTMSEQNLEGRRLLIKDGDDYSTKPGGPPGKGRPTGGLSKTAQKILNAQKQPAGPTLFFGNLSFQTTEQSIRELLDAHRNTSPKTFFSNKEEEVKEDNGKKDPWIRKVRLGTFEDTGVCKGWAFVDFTTIENATTALVNIRNHILDGRKLKVEYASADAVRRGGGPGEHRHPKKVEDGKKNDRLDPLPTRDREKRDKLVHHTVDDSDVHEKEHISDLVFQEGKRTRHKAPIRGKGRAPSGRLRPGAALAQAQRATAAIIPSQGRKITF